MSDHRLNIEEFHAALTKPGTSSPCLDAVRLLSGDEAVQLTAEDRNQDCRDQWDPWS